MKISYVRNLVMILSLVFFTACNQGKTPATGKTHTVDWFKSHKNERKMVLQECRNNPGELKHMPNCQNATKAEFDSSELKPIEW